MPGRRIRDDDESDEDSFTPLNYEYNENARGRRGYHWYSAPKGCPPCPQRAPRKRCPKTGCDPKRPRSAYIFFGMEKRSSIPGKVTEQAKELGRMWKRLSDGEKRKYQIMAENDKARYYREANAKNNA